MRIKVHRWPAPYRFGFGITDDPDWSTPERIRTIYAHCFENDIRPTLGTWVTRPKRTCGQRNRNKPCDGVTLEHPGFLQLLGWLKDNGVEFALHGVSSGDNTREEFIEGLEEFRSTIGRDPTALFPHSHNAENIHWGAQAFPSKTLRALASIFVPNRTEQFEGDNPDSEYFCGDIVRDRMTYVRRYRTLSLNALKHNPSMPYHIPTMPYGHLWFSGTAQDLVACRKITDRSLDRVAREEGLVLLYAHMAEKFVDEHGRIEPEAARALRTVGARQDCWRATLTGLLDRCFAIKNIAVTHRRGAAVISNPTEHDLTDLQVSSSTPRLFRTGGAEIDRGDSGLFVIDRLPAGGTLALFAEPHIASIGDTAPLRRTEHARMLFEEINRIFVVRAEDRRARRRRAETFPECDGEPVPVRSESR